MTHARSGECPRDPAALPPFRHRVALGGGLWMSAKIFAPAGTPDAVLFCLPGGGMNGAYFDLSGDFSFAEAMISRGFIVAALDYVGVGDSARPPDGFGLTAERLVRWNQIATAEISDLLRGGRLHPALPACPVLVSFGVGHSMGGMLTILQQHFFQPHSALALLGFATRGLPGQLTAEERGVAALPGWESRMEALARARFGGLGYVSLTAGPRGGSPGSRALLAARDQLLATPAMQSMLPGNVAAEAAGIDVPIFLGFGERDMVGPTHATPQDYPACGDLTLHIVAGAGHHPFVVPATQLLFARLGQWFAARTGLAAQSVSDGAQV